MCHRNYGGIRNFGGFWLAMVLALALSLAASAYASSSSVDYDTQQPSVNYDEYPVVVPKRAAILLDRLMVALQKAVESDGPVRPARVPFMEGRTNGRGGGGGGGGGDSYNNNMMERRGKVAGVWKQCFHNAVTCF